jgi:hypothetical protein
MLAPILSFIAILGLAALNRWLARGARMTRERGDPANRISLDLIDFEITEDEAASHGMAHVALGARPTDLAIAVARGDGWVTRRFGPGSLRAVRHDAGRVDLETRDFTLPAVALEFASAERAARWAARFAMLTGRMDGSAAAAVAGSR